MNRDQMLQELRDLYRGPKPQDEADQRRDTLQAAVRDHGVTVDEIFAKD